LPAGNPKPIRAPNRNTGALCVVGVKNLFGRGHLQLAADHGGGSHRYRAVGPDDGGQQHLWQPDAGVAYNVQANVVGAAGPSDWSDPVSHMVM